MTYSAEQIISVLFPIFLIFLHQTLAGNTPSNVNPNILPLKDSVCAHRPSEGQRWACEDPQLTFPTVACLTRDVLTCGNVVGKSCVFYSFGAGGCAARDFAKTLVNGKGVTFHDALDTDYISEVLGVKKFHLIDATRNDQNLNRRNIYVRKLAQAFASVCGNTQAFLLVKHYQGQGGGVGVYQTPWDPPTKHPIDIQDNVWLNDEFPSLQNNNKIITVYSVDTSNDNRINPDWTRGLDGPPTVPRDVEAIPLPPLQEAQSRSIPQRRDRRIAKAAR